MPFFIDRETFQGFEADAIDQQAKLLKESLTAPLRPIGQAIESGQGLVSDLLQPIMPPPPAPTPDYDPRPDLEPPSLQQLLGSMYGASPPTPAAPVQQPTPQADEGIPSLQNILMAAGLGGVQSAPQPTATQDPYTPPSLDEIMRQAGMLDPIQQPQPQPQQVVSLPHSEEPGTATDMVDIGGKWKTSFDFGSTYTGNYRTGTPHRGIDLVPHKGGIGTGVEAFTDGTVTNIARDSGAGGLMVYVQDDQGLTHTYMHLAGTAPNLAVGQRVARGQLIAQMGESGTEGSPHLHYEVRKNAGSGDPLNQLIDPRPYITAGKATAVQQGAAQNAAPSTTVPTTAGISGGGERSGRFGERGQWIMSEGARAAEWLGPDAQRALQAILVTEGGLDNARGDNGQSAGPLQFYAGGGQMNNLARFLRIPEAQAMEWVERHPVEAIQWAIGTRDNPGYLGRALAAGLSQGKAGADLATHAQRDGQVSVSPERAGANYNALFGGGNGLVTGGAPPPDSTYDTLLRRGQEIGAQGQALMGAIDAMGNPLQEFTDQQIARTTREADASEQALSRQMNEVQAQQAQEAQTSIQREQQAANALSQRLYQQPVAEPEAAAQTPWQRMGQAIESGVTDAISKALEPVMSIIQQTRPIGDQQQPLTPLGEPEAARPNVLQLQEQADAARAAAGTTAEPSGFEQAVGGTIGEGANQLGTGAQAVAQNAPDILGGLGVLAPGVGTIRRAADMAGAVLPGVGKATEPLRSDLAQSGAAQLAEEVLERTGGTSAERPSGGEWAGPITGSLREEAGRRQQIAEAELEAGMTLADFQNLFTRYVRGERNLESEVRRAGTVFQRHTVLNPESTFDAYARAPEEQKALTEGAGAISSGVVSTALLPGGVTRNLPGLARAAGAIAVDPLTAPFVGAEAAWRGGRALGRAMPGRPAVIGDIAEAGARAAEAVPETAALRPGDMVSVVVPGRLAQRGATVLDATRIGALVRTEDGEELLIKAADITPIGAAAERAAVVAEAPPLPTRPPRTFEMPPGALPRGEEDFARRMPGSANARFAADLASATAGGAAGYATTPEDASPLERGARTIGGAVLGTTGQRLATSPAARQRARQFLSEEEGALKLGRVPDEPMPWRQWPTWEMGQPSKTWYGDVAFTPREVDEIAVNSGFRRVSPADFYAAISRVADQPDLENPGKLIGHTLSKLKPEEYVDMQTFLAKDGGWGYALKTREDGGKEIVSVFKANEAPRGAGINATAHGVSLGATHLDAFDIDGRLPKLYSRFGFTETARYAYDPQYADPGTRGLYRTPEGKWVQPDVVEMERGTPAAKAAAEAEQARLLRLSARNLAQGKAAPAGATILEQGVVVPRRGKRAEGAGAQVGVPRFHVPEGGSVPLRSKGTKGLMGSAGSRVFQKAISESGGRKFFPVGKFTREDGSLVPYDSPQEVVFMSHLEEVRKKGEIKNWWRSEDSPIAGLKDIQYINNHPDKFGYGYYRGDFVIEHADGTFELRESKPEKVIRVQEEWGRSRAKGWTGELGWHVLKKAIGVIPGLAEQGVKYTIVPESEAGKLLKMAPGELTYTTPLPAQLPGGKGLRGKPAKTFVGLPGIDWRDLPELMKHIPGGSGKLPGHKVITTINAVSERAVEMAAQGATRAEITRYVRDNLLPTAAVVGREHGPTRLWTGASSTLGDVRGAQAVSLPEAAGMLEDVPEVQAILESAKDRGVTITGLAINPETRGMTLKASGDPAGIEAISAELAQATDAERAVVMVPDNAPRDTRWAQPVLIEMAGPEVEEALDLISKQLGNNGFVSYNETGHTGILNVLADTPEAADALGETVRQRLAAVGVDATLDNQVQVAITDLSGEGYATAAARRRELLGESAYGGAYPDTKSRGATGRSRAAGAASPGAAAGSVAQTGGGAGLPATPPGVIPGVATSGTGRSGLRHADEADTGAPAAAALSQLETAPDVGLPRRPPLGGRQAGTASARFAADLGSAAAGGAAGYATTPEDASPLERGARTVGGMVLGTTAQRLATSPAARQRARQFMREEEGSLNLPEPGGRAGPTMGGGTTGISQSPTFLRESLRRMYPGAINKAAAKEAVQNSVDASRGIPGATTTVIVDNAQKTIAIVDQGKGMSPQTMEDVFVKLGGSQKPAGAAGGMGTAIKAIMANAEDTWVRTIGRDPVTGAMTDSVMHGSGDDFLNGTMHRYYAPQGEMPYDEVTGAPREIVDLDYSGNTGTAIWTKPLADVDWSPHTLNSWITSFNKTNRIPDQNVEFVVDGNLIDSNSRVGWDGNPRAIDEHEKPTELLKTITAPGADIDFYGSAKMTETGYADVMLLNNGQYQADMTVRLPGNVKMPEVLVADIRSTVDPKGVGYPWTADRNSLIDTVSSAIKGYVGDELAGDLIRAENTRVRDSITKAPMIGPVKLVDDAQIGESYAAGRLAEIPKHPGYRRLANYINDLHEGLLSELEGREIPTPRGRARLARAISSAWASATSGWV